MSGDVDRPRSFRELLDFLRRNPRARITGPTPASRANVTREADFVKFEAGRLWFSDGFIPVACALTSQAAASEAGVAFDPDGFTVTKFGVAIRVEYLAGEGGGT